MSEKADKNTLFNTYPGGAMDARHSLPRYSILSFIAFTVSLTEPKTARPEPHNTWRSSGIMRPRSRRRPSLTNCAAWCTCAQPSR